MATKQDLAQTLKRTGELAQEIGLLKEDESLTLFEADRQAGVPWSVRLTQTLEDGFKRHYYGILPWLPHSGRSIGWTKPEAQEKLQTINGVLVTVVRQRNEQ